MRATPSSPTYSSTRRPVRFATRSLGSDGGAQPLARWRVERASVGERPGDEHDVTLERGGAGPAMRSTSACSARIAAGWNWLLARVSLTGSGVRHERSSGKEGWIAGRKDRLARAHEARITARLYGRRPAGRAQEQHGSELVGEAVRCAD